MKDSIEGVVIEVNAEIAKVRLSRHSNCSHCGMCQGADAVVLDAPKPHDMKPGQRVILEIKDSNMLKAAFTVFILPLIAIAVGIYLGYFFSSIFNILDILPIIICVVVFGLAAILAIKRLDMSLQTSGDKPKIVKVIE